MAAFGVASHVVTKANLAFLTCVVAEPRICLTASVTRFIPCRYTSERLPPEVLTGRSPSIEIKPSFIDFSA